MNLTKARKCFAQQISNLIAREGADAVIGYWRKNLRNSSLSSIVVRFGNLGVGNLGVDLKYAEQHPRLSSSRLSAAC